jgi:hypothetical protein
MGNETKQKWTKSLQWFPRILLIAYAFVELFFPLDQFSNAGVGILLNRLPTFIVLALAIATWKHLDWAPRIFVMLFIPFLMVFSLDVFSEHLSFWGTIFGLFIHNIPALILLLALVLVWKRELAGALTFCLAGLALFVLMILVHPPASMTLYAKTTVFLGLVVPPTTIGLLFFCNWARKKTAIP